MEDIVIKKLALILSVVFIILTFIGAGYVLLNGGKVNAGYSCVPMLFALISISFYRKYKWCVNDYLLGSYLGCFIAHSIILTKGEIYRYLSIQWLLSSLGAILNTICSIVINGMTVTAAIRGLPDLCNGISGNTKNSGNLPVT